MGLAIAVTIIVLLLFHGNNETDTFTVTCDKCCSHDVNVTSNGLKCRNCGSECKN
jgi:VCBS repeat-containing protein